MTALPPRNNLSGALWLITDMSLNIWALSIVKAMGPDVPAAQVVFLRSVTGFVLILPWIAVQRRQFRAIDHARLHLLRVVLAAATLTASFYAIARVPLALFTAIGFTRPVVTMIMAAVLLRETVLRRHWVAAAVALVGVIIAVRPGDISAPCRRWPRRGWWWCPVRLWLLPHGACAPRQPL